jgi:hypothetical protein
MRNMSTEINKQIELEIAHVLFIDIVGYSKLSINEQRAAVDELTAVVRSSDQYQIVSKLPAGPSYGQLRLDPEWDLLRGDPRFEKIVASLAPKDKQEPTSSGKPTVSGSVLSPRLCARASRVLQSHNLAACGCRSYI